MRIYIAASWPKKHIAQGLAEDLIEDGHVVIARWLFTKQPGYGGDLPETECSEGDFEDILATDVSVQITGDKESRGGRHSELGMAIAVGKQTFLLGPKEQVHHNHPLVVQCDTVERLLSMLPEKLELGQKIV